MGKANDRQVGGSHYKQADGGEEHWDRVHRLGLDYFQAQITKYVERWKLKNGLPDLKKAHHVLEKYIELHEEDVKKATPEERVEAMRPPADQGNMWVLPGHIKPTGWVGFVFEGVTANVSMFTCLRCHAKLHAHVADSPYQVHPTCPDGAPPFSGLETVEGEAERHYIRQEGDAA